MSTSDMPPVYLVGLMAFLPAVGQPWPFDHCWDVSMVESGWAMLLLMRAAVTKDREKSMVSGFRCDVAFWEM